LLIPSKPSRTLASAWRRVDGAIRREGDEGDEGVAYWNAVADQSRDAIAPLDRAEGALHPWTSRFVVPTFALANAGVAIDGAVAAETLTSPVGLGVFLGLVVGKPIGILGAVWAAVRTGVGELPSGITTPRVLLGIAALAGIGFTVSLFVADLAFRQPTLDTAKIGVLGASLVASVVGALILRRSGPRRALRGTGIVPPIEPTDLPERLRSATR
jgi:NhaA family Na+:H+ antiporter